MRDVKLRIKQARETAKLTQEGLAKKVGVTRGAVGLWESLKSKEVPTLDNLYKISRACNTSIGALVAGPSDETQFVTIQTKNVPVLSWDCVDKKELDVALLSKNADFPRLSCPVPHGIDTYALIVSGQSMSSSNPLSKSYPDGCYIYCDPKFPTPIPSGTAVIAFLPKAEKATFRILIDDGGEQWLEPLNERYNKITDDFEVRAVVVGAFHMP